MQLCHAAFASPQYAWLTANLAYLTPGLREVASIYDDEAKGVVVGYVNFLTAFSAVWLSLFALLIAFYFSPAVVSKNTDIHTTRSMLLYLPVPVVARVASIQALVEGILARHSEDATVASGGKVGGGRVAPAG